MRLWLIERADGADYEEHSGAVIRAETEEQVRSIAAEKLLPCGSDWTAPHWATVRPLDAECYPGDPGIVLESFHAG